MKPSWLPLLLALSVAPGAWGAPNRVPSKRETPPAATATPDDGSSEGTDDLRTGKPPDAGDKAAVKTRPTRVPEFTLPEVVITGENQLTVGAKRLERSVGDVTTGTRELDVLDRPSNDLPGLEKSLTATNARLSEPGKATAFVLHAGAGTPASRGGWALFGQEYRRVRYLLSGHLSAARGEEIGGERLRDDRDGYGLDLTLTPHERWEAGLSRRYASREEEIPGVIRGDRRGSEFISGFRWRFCEGWRTGLEARSLDLPLHLQWNDSRIDSRVREPEVSAHVESDLRHAVLEGARLDAGFRRTMIEPFALRGRSDETVMHLTLNLRAGDRLRATARGGFLSAPSDTPLRPDARCTLTLLTGDDTRWGAWIRRERESERLYDRLLNSPASAAWIGAPPPRTVRETGLEITRKFADRVTGRIAGSVGTWTRLAQWTDASSADSLPLRDLESVREARFRIVRSRLEVAAAPGILFTARHAWTLADASASSRRLTDLPLHEGAISVNARRGRWDLTLTGRGRTAVFASGVRDATYGAYATTDLSIRYEAARPLTLWGEARHLTGPRHETTPGFPETRRNLSAGLEILF